MVDQTGEEIRAVDELRDGDVVGVHVGGERRQQHARRGAAQGCDQQVGGGGFDLHAGVGQAQVDALVDTELAGGGGGFDGALIRGAA